MLEFRSYLSAVADDEAINALFKKIQKERDSNTIGYYDLPYKASALTSAKSLKEHLIKDGVLDTLEHIIIIGIGGSSLGIKAIDTMLAHVKGRNALQVHFLEHTDPIMITEILEGVEREHSLFFVISKSGTTIETTSLLKYVLARYDLLAHTERLLAITDEDSALEKFAKKAGIKTYTLEPDVGGRFSVLSHVGVLPLSLLGYDVSALLKGGAYISDLFFTRQLDDLLQKAIFYASNRHQYAINILFSYASALKDFNAWYVQLWGESLGKKNIYGINVGLTPISLIGSIDQHSFAQNILQGYRDKTVTFISLEKSSYQEPRIPELSLPYLEGTDFVNGASFATLLARQCKATKEIMIDANVPTDEIRIPHLCEESAGELIMYYELLTSCVGAMISIDTYNQPAVELAKERLRELFVCKITPSAKISEK